MQCLMFLFISKYAWYICAITLNVVMSYDCMPYMCLAVLYVLSCMFSVTILCYLIDDSKAQ